MTALKVINIFFIQFFFFRIARIVDKNHKQTHWGVIFPIVPFTGWCVDYIPKKYYIFKLWKKRS